MAKIVVSLLLVILMSGNILAQETQEKPEVPEKISVQKLDFVEPENLWNYVYVTENELNFDDSIEKLSISAKFVQNLQLWAIDKAYVVSYEISSSSETGIKRSIVILECFDRENDKKAFELATIRFQDILTTDKVSIDIESVNIDEDFIGAEDAYKKMKMYIIVF